MSSFFKRIKLLISSSLVIIPLLSGAALAAPAATPTPATPAPTPAATTAPAPTPPTTAAPAPTPPPSTETVQERVAKRIANLKTKLSAAEQKRLAGRCQGAQAVTKVLDTKLATVIENRTKVYAAIDRNLTNLGNKLTKQKIDVSTLTEQQAELKTKVAKLKTDATTYKQTLSDIGAMDCAKDPSGFRASVDEARILHDALVKEAAEVRAYATQTLGGTLQQIAGQLGGGPSTIKTAP